MSIATIRTDITAIRNETIPKSNTKVKVGDLLDDITDEVEANQLKLTDASAADLTKLSEVTATSTELNYTDGVTSAIQTQLDTKVEGSITDNQVAIGAATANEIEGSGGLTFNGSVLAVSGNVTVTDDPYDVSWDGNLEVLTKNAIYDKLESDAVDEAFRQVTYGTNVTDTYDAGQPNFYIDLTGNITLTIGSITKGGGLVKLNRSTGSETITLTGESIGNHTYLTGATDSIYLSYYVFDEGTTVKWICENPVEASGGGDVSVSGTPASGHLASWVNGTTISSDSNITTSTGRLIINSPTGTSSNLEVTNSSGTYSEILFGSTNVDTGKIGGLSYRDNAGSTRLAFYFNNNKVVLSNRASNGTVEIRANSATAGGGGEQSVALFEDDLISLKKNTDVTGNITVSGTVDGVDIASLPPISTTSTTVSLANFNGNYVSMAAANSATTYTTTGAVLGGWAIVRINAASEPTVTGATKIAGATFAASTDMHMVIRHNGTTTQYWFLEL